MVVEDDRTTCDRHYCVFFFDSFDVALPPSDIFLDDRFMPFFYLFSISHCPLSLRYVQYDHGLFTTTASFSILLS